jgi:predicted RNA-binding protein with RPS1 domain
MWSWLQTKSVTDVFKLDDMTEVVFLGMDAKGNMKLSRRELLRQRQQQQEQQQAQTVAAAS